MATVGVIGTPTSGATGAAGATSLTFAHTVPTGARYRCLVVGVTSRASTAGDVAVTYGGAAMALVAEAIDQIVYSALFRLVNPPEGTADVVVTRASAANDMVAGATTLENVDPASPTGTAATAANGNAGAATSASVALTSAANELVVDVVGLQGDSTETVGAGQTSRWNNSSGTATTDRRARASTEPGTASVTMSYSFSPAAAYALAAVSFRAVPTLTRATPQGAALAARGLARSTPQTAALHALGLARPVPQTAAIVWRFSPPVPQVAALAGGVVLDRPLHAPGTINEVYNPSFEVDLNGWAWRNPTPAVFAMDWARATDKAWDGAASAKGTVTVSTGLVPGDGLDGSYFYEERRVAPNGPNYVVHGWCLASNANLRALLRVEFWDATRTVLLGIADGADDPAHRTSEPFQRHEVNTPIPIGTAIVVVGVLVSPRVAGATGSVWFDGAQREMREQATDFAVGSYGGSLYRWVGAPHNSPSVRLPQPLVVRQLGRRGRAEVETRVYRATWDNVELDELTPHVRSGKATMDPDRAVKWDARLTLSGPAYRSLVPGEDFVKVWQTVTLADGSVREGQLGLYVVPPAPQTFGPLDATADLILADPTWILQQQAFSEPHTVTAGTNIIAAAKGILGAAGFATRGARLTGWTHARWSIPSALATLPADITWEAKTPLLKMINELLGAANYYALGANGRGIPTSFPYRDFLSTAPVRTYAANDPARPTEVVGTVKLDPILPPGNEVLVVNDDPRLETIRVVETIDAPWVTVSVPTLGYTFRFRIRRRILVDLAAATEFARLLAQRWASLHQRTSLSVLPDPSADFLHTTVDLAVSQRSGFPVAHGRYWCRGATFGLTATDPLVALDLAKVEDHRAVA